MKGPLSLRGCPSNCLTKMASDINIALGIKHTTRFLPHVSESSMLCSNKREGLRRSFHIASFIHLIHIHLRSRPPFHGRWAERGERIIQCEAAFYKALPNPHHPAWDFFFLWRSALKKKTKQRPLRDCTVINRQSVAWIINDLLLLMGNERGGLGKEEVTIAPTQNRD